MSLMTMSPNVQELDATGRKRSHDEFVEPGCGEPLRFEGKTPGLVGDTSESESRTSTATRKQMTITANPVSVEENQFTPASTNSNNSPLKSSTPFTNPESTPLQSPLPNLSKPTTQDSSSLANTPEPSTAPSPSAQMAPPPPSGPAAKRKRLTKEEKAAKDLEMAKKKQEREAEKAAKAAEKAKKEAEKDAEKAKRDAEKAQKDAERRQKAEEKERERRKREEDEARKARSQPKLNSFFKINPATPKKTTAAKVDEAVNNASPSGTPNKEGAKEASVYEQMFKPFFVKDQVSVARVWDNGLDEAAREAKSRILDECVGEKQGQTEVKPFDPLIALQLPRLRPLGRSIPSVRKIMAELGGGSSEKAVDSTTESQNAQIREAREALSGIPMKLLSFREDVRPPYYGTVTNYPSGIAGLRKLARNPLSKDILPLAYDYDSEAEWQDDDGEDIEGLDDDDEDPDNDEDMDDFLDDSEDAGVIRPAFGGGMEPESTGIRWENCQNTPPSPHMYKFRMEFILGKSLQKTWRVSIAR